MRLRPLMLALAAVAPFGPAPARAQSPPKAGTFLPAPATNADVGPYDAKIVQRAKLILASPAQWNKADTGDCATGATTFSISCALDQAKQEAAGIGGRIAAGSGQAGSSIRPDCRFHSAGSAQEGSCGWLFDKVSIITIAHAASVTTGMWRKDMAPTAGARTRTGDCRGTHQGREVPAPTHGLQQRPNHDARGREKPVAEALARIK